MNEILLGFLNVLISFFPSNLIIHYPIWKTLGWKKRGTFLYIFCLTLFISVCYFIAFYAMDFDMEGLQFFKLIVTPPTVIVPFLFYRRKRVAWQFVFLAASAYLYGVIGTGLGLYAADTWSGTNPLLTESVVTIVVASVTLPPLLFLLRRVCDNPYMKQAVVFWRFIWLLPAFFFVVTIMSSSYLNNGEKGMAFVVIRIIVYIAMLLNWYLLDSSVKQIAEIETAKHKANSLAADNAALENLNRMKTEFLQEMSHEIKTPLTVISGYVQQAAEELEDLGIENKYINPALAKAHEESLRLGRLTENALKMAVMQESRGKMKPLDPAELFTVNAESYRNYIRKQGNTLTINAAKDLPLILGNADRLIQVLTNLLANANKHTKNGDISVTVESETEYISVTVTDTGTGIDPELLFHVFDRSVTGSDGTGMGLAICKNIIEAHGGTIDIDSTVGKGTTVAFTIPLFDKEG